MEALFEQLQLFFYQLNTPSLIKVFIQLVIIAAGFFLVYSRLIKGSQADRLLKGVLVALLPLIGFWLISRVLDLVLMEIVLGASIQILFVGLIVIFQPELRRTLLLLGQGDLFAIGLFGEKPDDKRPEYLIHELIEASHFLSKSKRGALIVLESPTNSGGDYLEVGTPIDAKLSTELLLTIFHPNTPLHDGAVIISSDNRVIAAGVLLPLTENPELSWQYGTRHRAAIGLTELSDSRCIVISEETGTISLAHDGKLEKMDNAEDLKRTRERIYHVTVKTEPKRPNLDEDRLAKLFGINKLQKMLKSQKK